MNVTRKADGGELDPNLGFLIPQTTYSQRGVTFWEVSPSESSPAEWGLFPKAPVVWRGQQDGRKPGQAHSSNIQYYFLKSCFQSALKWYYFHLVLSSVPLFRLSLTV